MATGREWGVIGGLKEGEMLQYQFSVAAIVALEEGNMTGNRTLPVQAVVEVDNSKP